MSDRKPVSEAEKVARLQGFYAPQAEVILREMREEEERRFDNTFADRYSRDRHSAFARAFVGKCTVSAEFSVGQRGFKAPIMVIYGIKRAVSDRQLWRDWHEDIQTLGRARATLRFSQRLCKAAGMIAFTETVHQILMELALLVRKIGPIGATVLAAVGVDLVLLAISALRGCAFNAGQAMKRLVDNLASTGIATAVAGGFSGAAMPAIVIGALICVVCGLIIPAVYSNMDSKMTFKEFFVGILEALRLKNPAPVEEYVTEGHLHSLLSQHATDLLCPIGLDLMRHPVCLHGMVFEYEHIKRQILLTGRDALNDQPAALQELVPVPRLRALIEDLVKEFNINSAEVVVQHGD